jgi:olfactory receptor
MCHFLGILVVVDMGLATTIMPKILPIIWFNAKAISLHKCFVQMYAIHCFVTWSQVSSFVWWKIGL